MGAVRHVERHVAHRGRNQLAHGRGEELALHGRAPVGVRRELLEECTRWHRRLWQQSGEGAG